MKTLCYAALTKYTNKRYMTLASTDIVSSDTASSDSSAPTELTYFRTLLYAAIVGTAGGVVATLYYFVLEQLLE